MAATKSDGSKVEFDAVVRIDTPGEADYYRNGGIMQYVLRRMVRSFVVTLDRAVHLRVGGPVERHRTSASDAMSTGNGTVLLSRSWKMPVNALM
ncbi:hypothetical protein ALI22I_24230 [Saccharothrix sp. ALI-22-I]|uniref:hypothetical protein n=1 Tax=Saccharothrix sp. ALI-22-I TaxID=1933778 RepID=UPI00097C7588|nr:hypothetical protein [Saccharothrix sp. ALI-22-I]ONI86728.1 hypothetical protein ALI22I_24230 [Saccharothrix sp. ALI-22-I]